MSTMLISFCSVKGSPGVTSTALAAAAVWPRPVMLLEADPAGGDLAYRCISAAGGPPPAGKSLLTLAAGVRGGSVSPRTVAEHAQMLACGVHLVQGVTSPAQARGLGSLWAEVAEAVRGSEVDVIVDLGRLDRSSVTMPIAQVSDFLVPVAAASLESVMHLRDQLPELALAIRQKRGLSRTSWGGSRRCWWDLMLMRAGTVGTLMRCWSAPVSTWRRRVR